MKKLLFALPFLLLGVTGCSNTLLGAAAKLKAKDITSITLSVYSEPSDKKYVVTDENLEDVATKLLSLHVTTKRAACKCISTERFYVTTENASYTIDEYAFYGSDKWINYRTSEEAYDDLVKYALERAER